MKIKYYLRGLATGIVIAAILMAFSLGGKKTMSDEEVKERAMQLGMVMQGGNTLADGKHTGADPTRSEETKESQNNAQGSSGQTDSTEQRESADGTESTESIENTEHTESKENTESTESTESAQQQESTGQAESTEGTESAQQQESTESVEQSESTESTESTERAENSESGDAQPSESQEIVTFTIQAGSNSKTIANNLEREGLVEDAGAFDRYLCRNGYDQIISVGVFQIPRGSSEETVAKIITRKIH